ncbi:MAG: serine/threonine protein kinase, partial [Anaerolineales bacterium]|nr:serine/threonine protein kinase [Anaerolineales bacterium]
MAGLVGQMLDHYRLVEQIGQGGMATVYRAMDTRKLVEVAIKVLSPTLGGDKRFVRRFRREAQVVSRLKHPNIVGVTDYGEQMGYAYLVMPFVVGDTLYDRMTRRGVTQAEAARWMGQTAEALQFAHDRGVIHRDIKPSNIMVTRQGLAQLTDFGLARMTESSTSLTGSMILGTPAYVSPEQGRGGEVGPRSDQYSFGVILYQLSTGRLPFESDTAMGTVLMHLQEPAPPPRLYNPNLAPQVERVILKCLAKPPEDRFASVAALNDAYQRALRGDLLPEVEVPPARPAAPVRPAAPAVPRAARPRWPGYLLGAVALVALMVIGAALFLPPATPPPGPEAATGAAATLAPAVVPGLLASPTSGLPTPTATPVTSASCPGVTMLPFTRSGQEVSWPIDNGGTVPIRLSHFVPSFPSENPLQAVWLGGELLWEPPAEGPYPETGELPGDARSAIDAGTVATLRLV